jgi:cyclophilin family peptidyl-prolyl cis-trans isomerase
MRQLLLACTLLLSLSLFAQQDIKLKKKERKRDVELVTTEGVIVIRLSDSTPLHRDNFLRLVKSHYLDSMLFHRVINTFMIQSGDPDSKRAQPGQPLGSGGPNYTIPAEFRNTLFHQKGALAAARQGDDVNPEKKSAGSQFYIVQGKVFTDNQLDSIEVARLHGYKLPATYREIYKTKGGTPQLDQNYTVFGQTIRGLDVIDKIATTPTSSGADSDRPLKDMRIITARLIKRKKS